jgi:hypothetical protein
MTIPISKILNNLYQLNEAQRCVNSTINYYNIWYFVFNKKSMQYMRYVQSDAETSDV